VHRQKNATYKQAVQALRNSPGKGYVLLEEMGAIKQVDWRLRGYAAAEAYRVAAATANVHGKSRSVLVVSATWEEISVVTHAIREERKRVGELREGRSLMRHGSLNWTTAQKKQTANYRNGQVLIFHQAVKGVAAKNEALSVARESGDQLQARRASGELLTVRKQDAAAYGVFEAEGIEVCAGDKLLLQANWKDKGFKATNGELVEVAGVASGAIRLVDGRQLPEGYQQFTHGYAVTAHRSQGKTVDHVVILADRMARDLFYVTVTRGREALNVITSDKLALQEAIGVDADRQSAIELHKNVQAAAKRAIAKSELSIEDLHQAFTRSRQNQNSELIAQQRRLLHVTQTDNRYSAGL
jgi:predicted RNA-binding protein with PIN domain